jgi:hypothetical protein
MYCNRSVDTFQMYAAIILLLTTFMAIPVQAQYGGDFANVGFHDINSRLYTADGDWATGHAKAECGGDYPIMAGVSADPGHLWAFSALCVPSAEAGVTVNYDAGRTIDGRSDTSTGKWFEVTSVGAYWDSVIECADDEAMTGLSQLTTQFYEDHTVEPRIWYARCSPMERRVAVDCEAVEFANTNGYESEEPQDWAPNFIKGTCGPGRFMKGVANRLRKDVDWNDGGILGDDNQIGIAPAAILCCTPAFAGRLDPR